jgi:hypothetical protein
VTSLNLSPCLPEKWTGDAHCLPALKFRRIRRNSCPNDIRVLSQIVKLRIAPKPVTGIEVYADNCRMHSLDSPEKRRHSIRIKRTSTPKNVLIVGISNLDNVDFTGDCSMQPGKKVNESVIKAVYKWQVCVIQQSDDQYDDAQPIKRLPILSNELKDIVEKSRNLLSNKA